MTEDPEVSTTPAIPAQRTPKPAAVPPADAEPIDAAPPAVAPPVVAPLAAESSPAETPVLALGAVAPLAVAPSSAETLAVASAGAERSGDQPAGDPLAGDRPVGDQPAGAVLPVPGQVVAGRRTKIVAGVAGLAVLVLVLILGVGALRSAKPRTAAAAAPSAVPASVSASAATPDDRAAAVFAAQSAALLRGDQAGFLATVGPSLQGHYRDMYQGLRALGVTSFDYRPGVGQKVAGQPDAVRVTVDINYCFGAAMCPSGVSGWGEPPQIEQLLTLEPVGGKFVISKLAKAPEPDFHQPLPWESGRLVAVQGKRVTVLAPPEQARNLARVLPVAEQAAVVDDRFAALNHTPQDRYRIYLAGEKQWKSWYGGTGDEWAIGVSIPLNMYGTDVVLRMKDLTDPLTLRVTLQHELGHVVTLDGAFRYDAAEDTWLSEGIAEYIGWWPKPARESFRLASVRWALNGRHRPTSMVPVEPGAKASLRAGDAFYGLSHFAVDCMAHKYGQTKLFNFVRLVLTEDNSYDQAARDAYGTGFATVDRGCVAWIRSQV